VCKFQNSAPGWKCGGLALLAILSLLPIAAPAEVSAVKFNTKGLVTGWMTGNFENIGEPFLGIRCIPEVTLKKSLGERSLLDFEAQLNAFGTAHIHSIREIEWDAQIDLYRLWGRISTPRFEARIGLQKINFGAASLLRALMWFDSIDPRDPLQLTNGVYGLLLRYYFLNNTNIWLWGLYGNEDLKGWDFWPSKKNSGEFGGRIQMPLGNGEGAFTYHHRIVDPGEGPYALPAHDGSSFPEDRYALDGKWDLGVGLWFEGVLIRQRTDLIPAPWQRVLNIGLDYTFGIGNGLHTMTESFFAVTSDRAFAPGESVSLTAVSLGYPLGILDNLSCILYWDWRAKNLYSFINWRRTYDRWTINVIGFWNPESFQIYQNSPENSLYAGKGFQIMVIYYY
jgi:hypothetical protein